MISGSCLCGDIRFSSAGPAGDAAMCHCSQCRRMSGHYWGAVTLPLAGFQMTGTPTWYDSSDHARRGFCARCGSSLFWQRRGADTIEAALGSLDAPTGLSVHRHIFVADKGDYYDIPDGDITDAGA